MYIYLMRHGEALTQEENPKRPLSELGRENVSRMANVLATQKLAIENIYHSSSLRAHQTAELIANPLKMQAKMTILPPLEADNNVKALANVIENFNSSTFLVGHLPNLELVSNYLLSGDYTRPTITFEPATIACFKYDNNFWLLHWLIKPMLFEPFLDHD